MSDEWAERFAASAIRSAEREHDITDMADRAVQAIIAALNDRRGLKHEWRRIDPDIQEQIAETWAHILRMTMDARH